MKTFVSFYIFLLEIYFTILKFELFFTKVAAVVVLMACAVSAQFPPGWNYDPFKYYPFTALPPPVQETAEVAAARAAHLAAHAAVRPVPVVSAFRQPAVPQVVVVQPAAAILDTPEVWAAKMEHFRAHQAAAARNGVISSLPPLVQPQAVWGAPQPVQDTPEVHAARMEFFRAFNAAAARSG